jgi:DNA primase
LADEHMTLLKNFARRIILAYDDDAAGQGAAEKFYGWEQKLELDIHVLRLPAGADPGSTDPSVLADAVANARPFLEFWVDRILEGANLATAEGRTRGAEKALEAIAAHPNDLIRDQYVMAVADRSRVPADRLRAHLDSVRNGGARRPATDSSVATVRTPRPGVEVEALRLAIHAPESVEPYLEAVLFEDPVNLAAFDALVTTTTLAAAIDSAGPDASALLHRLAVEPPDPAIEADDIVTLLVRGAALRAVVRLEASARATGEAVTTLTWVKPLIDALGDPERRIAAATELVAWLGGAEEEG